MRSLCMLMKYTTVMSLFMLILRIESPTVMGAGVLSRVLMMMMRMRTPLDTTALSPKPVVSAISVSFCAEDQQKRRKVWRSFFNHWDLDANGYIDYEELRQVCCIVLPYLV